MVAEEPAGLRTAATIAITAGALAAFAVNTLLARLAMAASHMEPASYTSIRLLSTGAALALIGALASIGGRGASPRRAGGSWFSASLLLGSTLASTAGLSRVSASTGALIFFVTAQSTMFVAGLARGERPSRLQWTGVLAAVSGLAWMLAPGVRGPSPVGAALLVAAGSCWGLYSLRGRSEADAFAATRGNFLRCLPVAAPAALLLLPRVDLSIAALAPPIVSGAIASSLGSVLWYAAARRLSATRAATAQLTVPVLSAIGGTLLLSEPVTARLVLAGGMVLVGTGVAAIRRPAVLRVGG
jgi:drug/metabolite transporter (DMT)-like permease